MYCNHWSTSNTDNNNNYNDNIRRISSSSEIFNIDGKIDGKVSLYIDELFYMVCIYINGVNEYAFDQITSSFQLSVNSKDAFLYKEALRNNVTRLIFMRLKLIELIKSANLLKNVESITNVQWLWKHIMKKIYLTFFSLFNCCDYYYYDYYCDKIKPLLIRKIKETSLLKRDFIYNFTKLFVEELHFQVRMKAYGKRNI